MARLGCTMGILIRLSTEKEKYVNLKIEKRVDLYYQLERVTRDEHKQIGCVN
jgi:hypothetical protein